MAEDRDSGPVGNVLLHIELPADRRNHPQRTEVIRPHPLLLHVGGRCVRGQVDTPHPAAVGRALKRLTLVADTLPGATVHRRVSG